MTRENIKVFRIAPPDRYGRFERWGFETAHGCGGGFISEDQARIEALKQIEKAKEIAHGK